MTPTIFCDDLFAGEVAVVTGGGTGIGLSIAKEFGRLGAAVALCGRRPEPLESARGVLEAAGVQTFSAPCDIREPAQVAAFVASVVERLGRIDILVNNAGGQFPSPAAQIPPKGFEAVVRNNLLGTWTVTHRVANEVFLPQKRGRIVHITAQVGRGFPGMAHTGAARAGVENLTKTLAVEWAAAGIRVNSVAPGVIRTTGTQQYPPELVEAAARATPLRRAGTPEEVSHLVMYLASRQADYITGQTFVIDGGRSLWGDLWPIDEAVPNLSVY